MEMEIPFPFCVPVAAGIVSVSWEILFFSDSLVLLGGFEGDPLLFWRVSHENGHDAEGHKHTG